VRCVHLFQPAHTDMQRSLFDNSRFSDIVIKFSDREIKAHRFVLCECLYFDRLIGPDSPFTVRIPFAVCESGYTCATTAMNY
jgi:hypothetical protein